MSSEQIQDIRLMYEAVYNDELREKADEYNTMIRDEKIIEVATEYFYNSGLNSIGVDILIEELGEDEFVELVYDIAEEYTLTEARAGGVKIDPKTKAGKSVGQLKGGAKSAAINRLRKLKAQRREEEERASAAKPSGLKYSLQRQSAIADAQKEQPKTKETPKQEKKGIGSRIGDAFKFVKDRAKQDSELLGKSVDTARKVAARRGAEVKAVLDVARQRGGEVYRSAREAGREAEQSPTATRARRNARVGFGRMSQDAGRTITKAAGAAGEGLRAAADARREGKTGPESAGRGVGTFIRKMSVPEEYDNFDYILEYLISEGYADTNQDALAIMANMSEEWCENILERFVLPNAEKSERINKFLNKSLDHLKLYSKQIDTAQQELEDKKMPTYSIGKLVKKTNSLSKRMKSARSAVSPRSNIRKFRRDD